MKIGILTYHRSHNYGAILQAIALREYLISKGHEVYFVDYWPEYHKAMYNIIDRYSLKKFSLKNKLKYLLKTLLILSRKQKRRKEFFKFINAKIAPYIKPYDSSFKFDAILYGSDQIWRKQGGLNHKFNPVYFGENILNTAKHIAFSASMGMINLNEDDKIFLKSHLEKFDKIAVRETDLEYALSSLDIPNVGVTVDPTLLLSKKNWEELFNLKRIIEEPYILYYNLLGNSFDLDKVREYAKLKGKRLIIIEGHIHNNFTNKDTREYDNPEKFLSLIKHAEIVLTSSYHGMMFSIIFQKQFYVAFDQNGGRAQSILSQLGLEKRILSPKSNIPVEGKNIDYKTCENINNVLIERSKEFLNNNLIVTR